MVVSSQSVPVPSLLLVEEGIPLVAELFSFFERIEFFNPTNKVERHPLAGEAAALLTRSATKITPDLESFFPQLKVVGTTTAGIDHLNPWPGLTVTNAPGCNAEAVTDYVCQALFSLKPFAQDLYQQVPFGLIGVGEVGGRVAARLKKLGFAVVEYDPPRAEREPGFTSASWSDVLACPYISIHTPLVLAGDWPTDRLLNEAFFQNITSGVVLLNSSRGEVVDEQALLHYRHKLSALILDVYDREPAYNGAIVQSADIATPHIAGYSFQSFRRGAVMVAQYFRNFYQLPLLTDHMIEQYYQKSMVTVQRQLTETTDVFPLLEVLFSVVSLSRKFKQSGQLSPDQFRTLRFASLRSEQAFVTLNGLQNSSVLCRDILSVLCLLR